MTHLTRLSAFTGLILTGAIFGFFYAYLCSAMWGLDTVPPQIAIEAMQGINASVRNAVFAPAFFGTPFILALTSILAARSGHKPAARWFGAAAVIYLIGGAILTFAVNVPMNEALALIDPTSPDAAQIWSDFSPRWQVYNLIRTVASGVALLSVGGGLMALGR